MTEGALNIRTGKWISREHAGKSDEGLPRMRRELTQNWVTIAGIVITGMAGCSKPKPKSEPTIPVITNQSVVRADDLTEKVKVIGRLGVPLGTVMRVDGEVVPVRQGKVSEWISVARVDRIRGGTVELPETLPFRCIGTNQLPEGRFKELLCYETGDFRGIPDAVSDHMEAMPSEGFRFQTYLVMFPGD